MEWLWSALASAGVTSAGFLIHQYVRGAARDAGDEVRNDHEKRLGELLQAQLEKTALTISREMDAKISSLNGTYPRTGVFLSEVKRLDEKIDGVKEDVVGLRDELKVRPCIAHIRSATKE